MGGIILQSASDVGDGTDENLSYDYGNAGFQSLLGLKSVPLALGKAE